MKKHLVLLDDAPASGGGGATTTPASGGQPTGAPPPDPGAAATGTPAAAPTGLTPEAIATLVGETVRNSIPQPAAPQPAAMSQEELDKALRVYKPSAALVQKLRSENVEDAVAALSELVQGIHQQATTLSAYLLESRMEQVTGVLSPMQQFIAQQQQEQLKGEFFQAHPELKGLDPLLTAVRDQMVREGLKFKDKKSAFDECARRAQTLLKSLPTGGAAGGSAGGTPAAGSGSPPPSSMSTLSGGGQGGASAGAGSPAGGTKPNWQSLY